MIPFLRLFRRQKPFPWEPWGRSILSFKDVFFEPYDRRRRACTKAEELVAIAKWKEELIAKAQILWAKEKPVDFSLLRPELRSSMERKIINKLLPALEAFGWHNYPAPCHRAPRWVWLEKGWSDYPEGYREWRLKNLKNEDLYNYLQNLIMTRKVAIRFRKKKAKRMKKVEARRLVEMDKWLALVRDDPRENLKGAVDDIYTFREALQPWSEVNSTFSALYRKY